MRFLIYGILLILTPSNLPAQELATLSPNIRLDLRAGKLVNGVPEAFTFVFANISNHDVRLPPASPCMTGGIVKGELTLWLNFSPLKPASSGVGAVCAAGYNDGPSLLEQAKGWEVLRRGESYAITISRKELSASQQAPGTYEFYAEYRPPAIQPEDRRMLTQAGIEIPNTKLVSNHLTYRRSR